ncbi:MAG TPA: DNA gyrase subunit A [Candidatus Nanoarchaeia archaeon]|nr:DNA gyrase subunit A [Candidatus Nanoarchaeia archaeon]
MKIDVKMEPNPRIIPQIIEGEMKQAYVDYAMSVIVGRALPDVRDGLKPVHRRILFAMHESGLFHNKPFKKSAHIVGKVLAETHPHGDLSVYDALVRMTQDFSLRYPLVQGQGNWGSIDGDGAAAYRYTEARLNETAQAMLADIDKETVDFQPNFDASLKEPIVLPSKVPNLLVNGSTGIAVGMATNIPTHNMSEVCAAVIHLIDNPQADVDELMQFIPGPDFPTGAIIAGRNGILQAYKTGRGKVTVKAVADIVDDTIIVSQIPYMVNKSQMIEEIADHVRDKRIEGIRNIRDESDRDGIRVVVELKQGAEPQVVLNQLYTYSRLKTTFGIIFLALVDGQPQLLTLKTALQEFVKHRQIVVRKRTEYELRIAQEQAHILEGLIIALDHVDEIVQGIRASETVQDAHKFLLETFTLTDKQAKAILEMRLQKLASLEQQSIRDEHKELMVKIIEYQSILSSEQRIFEIIKRETSEVAQKFGDKRKTVLMSAEEDDVFIEELIEDKESVVTVTHTGYVKRIPLDVYKQQRRGGKGITGTETKEEDWVEKLFVAHAHDYMLCFTSKGQVHWLKVYEVPEGTRYAKGKPLVNLLSLVEGEKVSAIVPVRVFEPTKFVFMATRQGTVKKTPLESFSRPRRGGIHAVSLDGTDELIGAEMTDGTRQIMLATRNGMAVRFDEKDVRPMGRNAAGVRGIRLKDDDLVVSMEVADEKKTLLTVTNKGYGKRTEIGEYRLINRGGSGVTNIHLTDKNGIVVGVKAVTQDDELMFISKNGIVIRTPAQGISVIGRVTQGVRVMRLDENDELVAVESIVKEDEKILPEIEDVTKSDPPKDIDFDDDIESVAQQIPTVDPENTDKDTKKASDDDFV